MTTVVKERGEKTCVVSQTIYVCGGAPIHQSEIMSHPQGLYEKISYENPGKKRYGNCEHTKRLGNFPSNDICWNLDNCSPKSCNGKSRVLSGQLARMIPLVAANLQGFTSDYSEVYPVGELCAEAFTSMQPALSSGFSLSNFLLELRDIKSMFELVRKHKGLISNIGGLYLNYQFGWKLFLRDCQTMYLRLSNWEKTLADYLSLQGKPLVRHYRKSLANDTRVDVKHVVPSLGTDSGDVVRHASFKHDFSATMRYSYTIPTLLAEYDKFRAFREIWGLKLNASVIWEALPYSFVVDWFLNVGKYLQSIDEPYLESKVTILDFCYSIKRVESGYWTFTLDDGSVNVQLGTYFGSDYTRRRGLPPYSGFGEILSHRYGTKQILLSAALLVA